MVIEWVAERRRRKDAVFQLSACQRVSCQGSGAVLLFIALIVRRERVIICKSASQQVSESASRQVGRGIAQGRLLVAFQRRRAPDPHQRYFEQPDGGGTADWGGEIGLSRVLKAGPGAPAEGCSFLICGKLSNKQ